MGGGLGKDWHGPRHFHEDLHFDANGGIGVNLASSWDTHFLSLLEAQPALGPSSFQRGAAY